MTPNFTFPGMQRFIHSGALPSPPSSPATTSQASRSESPDLSHVSTAADPSTVCIAIIGVGFVGESLLREFGQHYKTIGFDISASRIAALQSTMVSSSNTTLTTDPTALGAATHFLISVPTLLRPDRTINLTHIFSALQTVLAHARPGSSIILESSVSVGTTRTLLGPYMHTHHCGMSPERVDPGRTVPAASAIPKIVSALTAGALDDMSAVYARVFETIVRVSRPEVAEMAKLFENCHRMVNIAYVNEVADACAAHGIDVREMMDAAATKPYGFTPFAPGLGVGGHCIPVNPWYLFANNRGLGVLRTATVATWERPGRLAREFHGECVGRAAVVRGVEVQRRPRVLVVGVGFKPGQSVLSCSPGLAFARQLSEVGCARLAFHDPLVEQADFVAHVVGEDEEPWMEKLEVKEWSVDALDAAFDGIAVCCRQDGVAWDVLEGLSALRGGHCTPYVKEFV